MATFRQMQRWLQLSAKNKEGLYGSGDDSSILRLTRFLSGLDPDSEAGDGTVWFRDGNVTTSCDCRHCRKAVSGLLSGQQLGRMIDAMSRRFGADTDADQFLQQMQRQQQQAGSAAGESGQGGDGQQQQAEAQEAAQAAAQAADRATSSTAQAPKTASQLAQQAADIKARAQEAANNLVQSAKESIACLQKKLQAMPDGPAKEDESRVLRHAKRQLKKARNTQSAAVKRSQPSLTARKGVSRGLGRLRRVDIKTRARMAVLINRILGKGTAGEQLTPIPVTDPRRLVKRLLSRRPLANSFKEDSDSGRPAILFLPDISPSCAAQAQAACDIANAAGYAGIPGADVLVMPHFNGGIDSDCEEYMPWLNGRPMTLLRDEQSRLFADATQGRRFNIKAVVIVGDHDGEMLYRQMAELPKIRQIIWLHNYTRGELEILPAHQSQFNWPKPDTPKFSVVLGCINASTMMRGLELVT